MVFTPCLVEYVQQKHRLKRQPFPERPGGCHEGSHAESSGEGGQFSSFDGRLNDQCHKIFKNLCLYGS